MKKLILLTCLITFLLIKPEKASAYYVNGWANISIKASGGYTLTCNGFTNLCAIVNGTSIRINHWSGWIDGTLQTILPAVIPSNFPIEFDSEQDFPTD